MLHFKGTRGIITPPKYYVITKFAKLRSADRSSVLRKKDTKTRHDRTSGRLSNLTALEEGRVHRRGRREEGGVRAVHAKRTGGIGTA